ncbi:MAG: hypothetical protein ABEJ92_05505 [Halobacteriales archaeon]
MPEEPPWYRSGRGIAVVVIYGLLTLVALAVSTEPAALGDGYLGVNTSSLTGPSTRVPPAVYLYGFLGAMAYAFTSIVAKFERGPTGVLRVGLRALAALPLAGGVYLLAGMLGLSGVSGSAIAGVAFLVGLYVNLTLKALGGLADRLYGRVPGGTGDGSDAVDRGGSDGAN